jgi:ABC-type sulfate/molybdate transport systems ATPase subunit
METEPVPLLLLDEPFADLDDDGVRRLRADIERAVDGGRAVIVATHAHHEIDVGARTIVLMEEGVATAA